MAVERMGCRRGRRRCPGSAFRGSAFRGRRRPGPLGEEPRRVRRRTRALPAGRRAAPRRPSRTCATPCATTSCASASAASSSRSGRTRTSSCRRVSERAARAARLPSLRESSRRRRTRGRPPARLRYAGSRPLVRAALSERVRESHAAPAVAHAPSGSAGRWPAPRRGRRSPCARRARYMLVTSR